MPSPRALVQSEMQKAMSRIYNSNHNTKCQKLIPLELILIYFYHWLPYFWHTWARIFFTSDFNLAMPSGKMPSYSVNDAYRFAHFQVHVSQFVEVYLYEKTFSKSNLINIKTNHLLILYCLHYVIQFLLKFLSFQNLQEKLKKYCCCHSIIWYQKRILTHFHFQDLT